MEVADNHNFIVNGGLTVHNCMDATRYFVKTMRLAEKNRRRVVRDDNVSGFPAGW